MAQFKRTLVAEDGIAKIRTEALGNNTKQFGTKDLGVIVALGAASCLQCAAGQEIYGNVHAVETGTINDGFSYGSVKQSHRIEAVVGANQVDTMEVGDLVVADVQSALGTGDLGKVKSGEPATHKWQCISVAATGAIGETVLLEKV